MDDDNGKSFFNLQDEEEEDLQPVEDDLEYESPKKTVVTNEQLEVIEARVRAQFLAGNSLIEVVKSKNEATKLLLDCLHLQQSSRVLMKQVGSDIKVDFPR